MDAEAEAQIQRAIAELMAGRTSLVVAHRLSTILHADEILVLHHGEIRERGSHRELLAQRRALRAALPAAAAWPGAAQDCLTRCLLARLTEPRDTFVGDRLHPRDPIDDAPRNRRRTRFPCAAGETIIGSAPWLRHRPRRRGRAAAPCRPPGHAAGRRRHPRGRCPTRRCLVNGVRLGADPTPVLHGDKIQIGRPRDPRGRPPAGRATPSSSTRGAFADLRLPVQPRPGAAGRHRRPAWSVSPTAGSTRSAPSRSCSAGTPASDVVVTRQRRLAPPRRDPGGARGLRPDGPERERDLRERRAGRPPAPAGPGRRDPDRARRVPLLRRRRSAAGSDGRRAACPRRRALHPPTGAGARLSDTMHGLSVRSGARLPTP